MEDGFLTFVAREMENGFDIVFFVTDVEASGKRREDILGGNPRRTVQTMSILTQICMARENLLVSAIHRWRNYSRAPNAAVGPVQLSKHGNDITGYNTVNLARSVIYVSIGN